MSFLILLGVAVALAPIVMALVALARSGRITTLEARVAALEADLTDLRKRFVAALRREAALREQAQAPAVVEAPAPPPVIEPPAVVETPVTEAPTPIPPMAPPAPPKAPIEWERWIGIRGAAVLGGIALALAGLLFFQYSIQHGLISPAMRVALGLGVGITCLVLSEWMRPRGYRAAADGLAGAGVVVLYAALWAGSARYQLLPVWTGFLLMALVTATAGWIAVRRSAPLVAILGLLGGFATPLLVGMRHDRPIGVFGYVLLLDVGLLAVGRRRGWTWLGGLALAGTVVLQTIWLAATVGPGGLFTALAILAVFAALFAVDRSSAPELRAGAVLWPLIFAVYFASRADLGPHLWGIAAFAIVLGAGASWVARNAAMPQVAYAAAVGGVGILAAWLLRRPATPGMAMEAVTIAVSISLVYHLVFERGGAVAPAILAAAGSFLVLLLSSVRAGAVGPWTWLAGWIALAAFLVRQGARARLTALLIAAPGSVAVALALQHIGHSRAAAFPGPGTFLAGCAAVAVLAQLVTFVFRDEEAVRGAEHGAALGAAILSASLVLSPLIFALPASLAYAAPVLFGILVLLAATRLGEGEWGLAAVLLTAVVHAHVAFERTGRPIGADAAPGMIALMLVAVIVFMAWPFLSRRLAATRWIWWAAALAAPLWFFPIKHLWEIWLGKGAIGIVPVTLGAMALGAVFAARRLPGLAEAPRRTAIVGLSAVAVGFASVAIPLQLDRSWVTIGWALEGLGLVWLWRRLDHAGLKWFGLLHLGAAALRLVPTEALLGTYPRSGTPIVNWVLYTYLVPAAAMLAAAWLLAPQEVARAKPFEREIYARGRPIGGIAATIGGIFVVFVWINVAIADWFADGPTLTLRFGRAPARDLTVSIAWALYALVLLGFGMARARTGLRWLSLGFLLVTIAKVFLYDLGELRDLYRVLSLVGLALSLLLVSVLYQRFVFRRRAEGTP